MRALVLNPPVDGLTTRLEEVELPVPEPAADELLVRVGVCGVCRTDLDLADGRLQPPQYPVIPGHQIVGVVAARGRAVSEFREGDRVGIAWIHSACGTCTYCVRGNENLCARFRATGCDAPGGYAEYTTVSAQFAYAIPVAFDDVSAAPLLCAGAIGLRSLRLANLRNGEPLGLTGFGASAHLILQFARAMLPDSPIYVFARNAEARAFALELGAAWAGNIEEPPPEPAAAIIDTTPAWRPVVRALRSLRRGGMLVINAIRKERADQQALLDLDYATDLWLERELRSVANVTRADVRECLSVAADAGIRPSVATLPLERANHALAALRAGGGVRGALAIHIP